MKRRLLLSFLLACALFSGACGACDGGELQDSPDATPDEDFGPPPEDPAREIPVQDGEFEEMGLPDLALFPEGDGRGYDMEVPERPECCEVRFALADPYLDVDADRVRLRGTQSPLNQGDGVEMTLADGVWSGTACISPLYDGVYFYEVARDISDPGRDPAYDIERVANQAAPGVEQGIDGPGNRWPRAQSCELLDLEVHARTTL